MSYLLLLRNTSVVHNVFQRFEAIAVWGQTFRSSRSFKVSRVTWVQLQFKLMQLTFVYAQKWNARHPNIIQHESTDSGETQPFKWLMMTVMMMMMIEPPKLLHVFSTSVCKSYFVYLLNSICLFSESQRDVWEVEISLIIYLNLVDR